jgi:hypothetical protein
MIVKHLLVLVLLCASTAALGGAVPPAPTGQNIHPAVVRVIVTDRDGTTFGSGSLVAASGGVGLVLTNWHVVRDVAGPITVLFPDGSGSLATVLRIDRDWDLAALAIRRPNVQPIPLAMQPPRPGETLTIAGYGKGWYRAASGSCTQYLSPGGNLPNEMVELAASAREGDSGGPILNSRGELAGVLFGTGMGRTMGSYCGRVRWFVASVADDFNRLADPSLMIARQPPPAAPPLAAIAAASAPPVARAAELAPAPHNTRQAANMPSPTNMPAQARWGSNGGPSPNSPPVSQVACPYATSEPLRTPGALEPARMPAFPASDATASVDSDGGQATRLDQLKTILAGMGLVLVIFEGMRLAARAAG